LAPQNGANGEKPPKPHKNGSAGVEFYPSPLRQPHRYHAGGRRDLDRVVVGHLDDQVPELGLQDLARQHALFEPALQLGRLAACRRESLRQGVGRKPKLGGAILRSTDFS
jgi:hypothetical protein